MMNGAKVGVVGNWVFVMGEGIGSGWVVAG